jgi:hypothetical protein
MEPVNPWIQRTLPSRSAPINEVYPRQCPCLGLLIHGESMCAGGFDGFRQKHEHMGFTQVRPPKGKDLHPACLILYCWYSLSCYSGGVDEIWPRWKKMACASLCMWDLCEIICLSLSWPPSSPLYGGQGLGIRSKSITGVCEP